MCKFLSKKLNVNFEDIENLVIWLLPISIICARLYYVILSWNYYSLRPNEIIMVQNGGLSIHGGIIFGILAAFTYCKINKIELF